MSPLRRYDLPGGAHCELFAPPMPGVADYHVLAADRPLHDEAVDELARLASHEARRLGRQLRGDEGAFTVILNGSLASRRPWAHAHIIPVCSPAQKRRAFALLSVKGPLRKAERLLHMV